MVDFDSIRRQIMRGGRFKANRIVSRDFGVADDWALTSVTNAVTGMPYVEAEAWNLICALLEGGHVFRNLILESPKGLPALETTYERHDLPTIYIKVHLYRGKICGRSFHCQLKLRQNDRTE